MDDNQPLSLYTITSERLKRVYDSLYEYYTRHGYSAWIYWRTTTDCAAVYGELLEAAISESNPNAWDKIWEDWLLAREEPAATAARSE